ncbi:MAG: hypothetical protein IKF19_04260 [Bacilli bacterium]|nr:hypothetical protein [Bacilli bacterium]
MKKMTAQEFKRDTLEMLKTLMIKRLNDVLDMHNCLFIREEMFFGQ